MKVEDEQADQLHRETLECVKKKSLITVYRCSDDPNSRYIDL